MTVFAGSRLGSHGRGRRLCAALAVGTAWCLATPAAAQEATYAVAPPETAQRVLNPVVAVSKGLISGFYPALTLGVTYDSNIFRTPDNEESDIYFTVSPTLLWKQNLAKGGFFGRHSFQIGLYANFSGYDRFPDEDAINWGIDAGLNLDLTRILDVDLLAGYAEGAEQRGAPGVRSDPTSSRDKFQRTRVGAAVTLGRRTNTLQLQVGITHDELTFTNNDQSDRDRDQDIIYGTLFYNLGPRTQLLFDVSEREIDYRDPANNDNSTTLRYGVGVTYQTTAITNLNFRFGRSEREYADPTKEKNETDTYSLRFNWQARPRTSVGVYGARTFEESADAASDAFVHTLLGTSVNQGLADRWSLNAFANFSNDDFDDGREDDIFDTAVGLSYAFRPWMSLSGRVGHIDRSSNRPEVEYDAEYASLFVTFRRP